MVIKFFVKHDNPSGTGDKFTVSGNIKGVMSHVIEDGVEPVTEDGQKLDGLAGMFSIVARMVNSVYMNGILTNIIIEKSKEIAREYNSKG